MLGSGDEPNSGWVPSKRDVSQAWICPSVIVCGAGSPLPSAIGVAAVSAPTLYSASAPQYADAPSFPVKVVICAA